MEIAIIGAGFTGLSAAWELLKKNHHVTIFEKESGPGGLAIGFSEPKWDWSLEKHYHHIFESDKFIQKLADEVGHKYQFYDVKTSTLIENSTFQLDSPLSLLKFPKLTFIDRLRMGTVLGYLKYFANWQDLEKYTATIWLPKHIGENGYRTIWEPLLKGKFGVYANQVNMAWFWARIKARSQKLGYFDGGFLSLAQTLVKTIEARGGKVLFKSTVNSQLSIVNSFDKVIICGATGLIKPTIPYLGSVTMVLRLKEKFLPNNIYWLNINMPKWPFLAIVEHTNMINKSHYNNEHLVYIGKYLPINDHCMTMNDHELLDMYTPYLSHINPSWQKSLIGYQVFRAKLTQPVMPINYSVQIPKFETDNPKVLQASMQQVYPWDRGTNFAVELGQKVAKLI